MLKLIQPAIAAGSYLVSFDPRSQTCRRYRDTDLREQSGSDGAGAYFETTYEFLLWNFEYLAIVLYIRRITKYTE